MQREKIKIPLHQRLQSIIKKLFYYNKNAFYTEMHLFGLCVRFKSYIFNRDLYFKKIFVYATQHMGILGPQPRMEPAPPAAVDCQGSPLTFS